MTLSKAVVGQRLRMQHSATSKILNLSENISTWKYSLGVHQNAHIDTYSTHLIHHLTQRHKQTFNKHGSIYSSNAQHLRTHNTNQFHCKPGYLDVPLFSVLYFLCIFLGHRPIKSFSDDPSLSSINVSDHTSLDPITIIFTSDMSKAP